ncbi:MAG: HD domain-containing protein [Chloroflexi bacterium]|nr:HD domain-containing protein [Chloroflexota bacterium]
MPRHLASDLTIAEAEAVARVATITAWAPAHTAQVQRLARQLFEALRDHHGLGPRERRLLEVAALLHDVGFPTNPARHHKVSARVIRANLGAPFTERDVHLIALLARYHRKGGPRVRHRRFSRLEPGERQIVIWLAGLLRVADGLDRPHASSVQRVTAGIVNGRFEITASGGPEHTEECICGGSRKRQVLERALGRPIVIWNDEAVRPASAAD